jgi:hypothetical protein
MKDDNKIIKLVYTFFLGILLTIFIGVGTSTFYPGPKTIEYPTTLNTPSIGPTSDQIALRKNYNTNMQRYNNAIKTYDRNVSIITLGGAIIFLVISLIYEKKIKIISDGIMLGGLFTLLYSIERGFASQDTKYTFLTVTVGLLVALYLGYHRFVRGHSITGKVIK